MRLLPGPEPDGAIFNLQTIQIATMTVRPDLTLSTGSPVAGTYFPDGWVNRQDQASIHWTTNPPTLPSNVTLTYQVGVSVSSSTSVIPTLTGWINIATPPPVSVTGLGMGE